MRFLLAAALIASVLSPRALACDCDPTYDQFALVEDGAPPNVEPLVSYPAWATDVSVALLEAGTLAPVLGVETTWAMGTTVASRLEPLAPLDEGGEYVIQASGCEHDECGVITSQAFTVSNTADEAAPSSVAITAISALDSESTDAACGPYRWIYLDVSLSEDESLVFYEVEVSTSEDMSDATSLVFPSPSIDIGSELCRATWGGIEAGGAYWVRARAIDIAGNTADWSDPEAITLVPTYPGDTGEDALPGESEEEEGGPGGKDGGCGGGKALLIVGLGALLARRRR